MIVDDRLATVLRTDAAGKTGLRTQFRQVADLLGRVPEAQWGPIHDCALDRLDALRALLGDDAAAVLLRTCVLRSPRLVDHLARAGSRVALAAIAHARLDEDEWLALIPGLPVQARGFLRHRGDLGEAVEALLAQLGITDFVLPRPPVTQPTVTEPTVTVATMTGPSVTQAPVTAAPSSAPSPSAQAEAVVLSMPAAADRSRLFDPGARDEIGAIVRRIEAFRRHRVSGAGDTEADQSRLPLGDELPRAGALPAMLDISIDAGGTIIAADEGFAPMLVGHHLFGTDAKAPASADARSNAAFAAGFPLFAGQVRLEGAPPIAGEWRIDAVPVFARGGGQFQGYRGWLRRLPAPHEPALTQNDGDDDRLRQLLHELRTPINAIQGFAELIQQQVFGPTPHQYRGLSASIAADAARMLAGFEDVERLVRLETGQLDGGPFAASGTDAAEPVDLRESIERLVAQLDGAIAPREIRLRCQVPARAVMVHAVTDELEQTLWRLLSVIIGNAAPGERLTLTLGEPDGDGDGRACLTLPLPGALALHDDATLFAPDMARVSNMPGGAMLGAGFSLRLAAAEIRAGGGTLHRKGANLTIRLPLALPALVA